MHSELASRGRVKREPRELDCFYDNLVSKEALVGENLGSKAVVMVANPG